MRRRFLVLIATLVIALTAHSQESKPVKVPVFASHRAPLQQSKDKSWKGMKAEAGVLNQGKLAILYNRFDGAGKWLLSHLGVKVFDANGRLLAAKIHPIPRRAPYRLALDSSRHGWRILLGKKMFFLTADARIEREQVGPFDFSSLLQVVDISAGRIAVGHELSHPFVVFAKSTAKGTKKFKRISPSKDSNSAKLKWLNQVTVLPGRDVLLTGFVPFGSDEGFVMAWFDGEEMKLIDQHRLSVDLVSRRSPVVLPTKDGVKLIWPGYEIHGCFSSSKFPGVAVRFRLDRDKKKIEQVGMALKFTDSALHAMVRFVRRPEGGYYLAVPGPASWLTGLGRIEPILYPIDVGIWSLNTENELKQLGVVSQLDAPYAMEFLPARKGQDDSAALLRLWGHSAITTIKVSR